MTIDGYEVVTLCSDFDAFHELTCDLPKGHAGEHQATVFWGHDGND